MTILLKNKEMQVITVPPVVGLMKMKVNVYVLVMSWIPGRCVSSGNQGKQWDPGDAYITCWLLIKTEVEVHTDVSRGAVFPASSEGEKRC